MSLGALPSQDMPFENNNADFEMPFDDEALRLASELAGAFVKTTKGKLYYSDDYPILKEYIAELDEAIRAYFYCYELLEMQVAECQFTLRGRVIHSTEDVSSSVPFLLFKDGVRTVRLMFGLDIKEMLAFIELLQESIHLNAAEDDLVTLLMEREFPHIEVAAVDDFLFYAESAIPLTQEEYRAKTEAAPTPAISPNFSEDFGYTTRADEENDRSLKLDNGPAFRLTPEETIALRKELTAETAPIGVARMAPVLFEILSKEEDHELFTAAADGIGDFIERAMVCGDFKKAAILHAHAQAFSSAFPANCWQFPILRQLIDLPGRADLLQYTVPALQKEDGGQLESIQRILHQLTPLAIPTLIEMFNSIHRASGRDIVAGAITAIAAKEPASLGRFVEDQRENVALRVIAILSGIGGPSCLHLLARGLSHDAPAVRKAVVTALRPFDGDHTERVLTKALKDADEGVRNAAAIELGRLRTMTALSPLLHAAQPKALRAKSLPEVKALLEGIAHSEMADAIPLLKSLLEDMPIMGKARADAIRVVAARALAAMPLTEARAVIAEGAQSNKRQIRDACLEARKHAPKHAGEGGKG